MSAEKALVTGVSSGLGEALATELIRRDFEVFGLSRSNPAAHLCDDPRFHFESCDFSKFDTISPAMSRLLSEVKSIDLIFLNAGVIGQLQNLADCPLEEILTVMDVNVWANKYIIDYGIKNDLKMDHVIGISSGASQSGSKGWAGYSLSKCTLNMLLRLYASECEETHFTALAPGLVLTKMLQGLLNNPDKDEFPSLNRLHSSNKFTPAEAATNILDRIDRIKGHPSGAYVDLRDLLDQESF